MLAMFMSGISSQHASCIVAEGKGTHSECLGDVGL